MRLAVLEAEQRGHHYVGPEHLLLALLATRDDAVLHALRAQRVDPRDVQRRLTDVIGRAEHATTYQAGLTHRSRSVLALAVRAAHRERRSIVPLDLLRAIIEEGGSVAARVLRRLGMRRRPS